MRAKERVKINACVIFQLWNTTESHKVPLYDATNAESANTDSLTLGVLNCVVF